MGVCCVTRKEPNPTSTRPKSNPETPKNSKVVISTSQTFEKEDIGGELKIKKAKTVSYHKKAQKVKETKEIVRHASATGAKMINNYTILKLLGQGGFGKVKLASKNLKDFDSFEKKYAIKIYKKANLRKKRSMVRGSDGKMSYKDALQEVAKEIAVMKKLDHPNVVRLHEVIDDEEKDKLYMVLDYAAKGQLIEWDEDEEKFYLCHKGQPEETFLPESKLHQIFRECLTGIHYLHANHIIHRDIKPQNILFDEENHVKIADFGQSILFEDTDRTNAAEGTYWFMAPELLDTETNKEGVSGKACDVWSLGITFFVFAYLEVPFYGDNIFDLLERIREGELVFRDDKREISMELKDIMRKMLNKNPLERISIDELIKNTWFQNEGVNLDQEILMLESVIIDDQDVKKALIPIERAFFLKKVAKKMKNSIHQSNSNDSKEQGNQKKN